MNETYSNFKIKGVVYNILENKIPNTTHTYNEMILSMNPTNKNSKVSPSVKRKIEKFYKNPDNIKQVLFLFMGPFIYYDSDDGKVRNILNKFTKHIQLKKPVRAFPNLDYLLSLDKLGGDKLLQELNICDDTDNYLFSEVYFLEEYISNINSITEVEKIITYSINNRTKYSLKYNKILSYTNIFIDTDIINYYKKQIIIEFKDNPYSKENLYVLLKRFNIYPNIVDLIINNIYGGNLLLEDIPEFLNNDIIIFLLELYLRYRPISYEKFKDNEMNNFVLNSYILSIFEKDSIYTNFNTDKCKRSTKLLGSLTDSNLIYVYDYDNIKSLYKNTNKLNYIFPFNKALSKPFTYSENNSLIDTFVLNKNIFKLNRIYVTDINTRNVLSKKQHPLIYLFNKIKLSKEIPFSKFNDLQGGDEIFKVFKESIRIENDNYKPIITKRLLDSWCNNDLAKLEFSDINKLYRKLRKKKAETLSKIPKVATTKIILTFKVKIGEYTQELLTGKIYKFNINNKRRVSLDIKPDGDLKIERGITNFWGGQQRKFSVDTVRNLTTAALGEKVKFYTKKSIYASVYIYNIGIDGQTKIKIQIDTSKIIHYNILETDYRVKINDFLFTHVYSDKYYTDKFVISYKDLNYKISSISPYYPYINYNVNYHFTIKSSYPLIHERVRIGTGIKIHDDIAWGVLLRLCESFNNYITLDESIVNYEINNRIFFYKKSITPHAKVTKTQNSKENWIEGTVIGINSDNTYKISLDTGLEIKNVNFKNLKRKEKQHLILSAKKPYDDVQIILDYHYLFNVKQTVDCVILKCNNKFVINYLKKIIDFIFSIYNFINNKKYDNIDIEPFREILLKTLIPKTSVTKNIPSKISLPEEDETPESDDSTEDSLVDESSSDSQESQEEYTEESQEESEEESQKNKGGDESRIMTVTTKKTHIEKFENIFLERLYNQDRELFAYNGYSDSCQASRVPKILSDTQKETIDAEDKKNNLQSYGITSSDRDCNYETEKDGFDEDKLEIDGQDINDFLQDNKTNKSDDIKNLKNYKKVLDGDNSKKLKTIKCKALKYGSSRDKRFWYICPRIYDKLSSMPIDSKELVYYIDDSEFNFTPKSDNWRTDVKTNIDIEDLNVKYKSYDGQIRDVWIAPKHRGTGQSYFYPGFLNYNSHPKSSKLLRKNKNPLYPVCCFQRYSNRFNELIKPSNQDSSNYIHEKSIIKNKYILIPNKDVGVLPNSLNRIFNQTKKDIINPKKSQLDGVFVRVGLGIEDPTENESFLLLMIDILYKKPNKLLPKSKKERLNKIKNDIITNFITNNNTESHIKVYYPNINNGFLKQIFNKLGVTSSYQNFLEYIISGDLKKMDFFYEIFTSKYNKGLRKEGIKTSYTSIEGLLLVIFNIEIGANNKLKININCPYFSKNISKNLDAFSHIAMGIKYRDQFEVISYKKYIDKKSQKVDSEMVNIFSRKDVFKETYKKGEEHLRYIKNIIVKYQSECSIDNTLEYNYPGLTKITFTSLKYLIISSSFKKIRRNKVIPIKIKVDSVNNNVTGILFEYIGKKYTIAVLPEIIDQSIRNKFEESVQGIFKHDSFDKTTDGSIIQNEEYINGLPLPTLEEYTQFYKKIYKLSRYNKAPINIKIIKYSGVIKNINYSETPPMASTEINGFTSSFISGINKNNPNINKTLLYINCLNETRDVLLDDVLFNYNEIDRNIENQNLNTKISFKKPIDISTFSELLTINSGFIIKEMYTYYSKVLLIKTTKDIFIPIQEQTEQYMKANFEIDSNVKIKNLFTEDAIIDELNFRNYNPDIKINKDHLIAYCEELARLSHLVGYKVPIFIKTFNTDKTGGQESCLYLESGISVEGEDYVKGLKIIVNNLDIIDKVDQTSAEYLINKVKKYNIDFYTEREIISRKLDISTNYGQDIKLAKFNYDRYIYDAVLKKLNEFFSIETSKVVKMIKLFMSNTLLNSLKNKGLHDKFKKRLLYPLIFKLLDIIIEPIHVDDNIYPPITIDDLSNLENNYVLDLGDDLKTPVTPRDVDNYITKSYTLINSDISTLAEVAIKNKTLMKSEYSSRDTEIIIDYKKATQLYYDLIKEYHNKTFKKIDVLRKEGEERVEFLRYKICENLVSNNFIQNQIFKIYQNPYNLEERFVFDIKDEILFTKLEMENYLKLDELYKVAENKYYSEMLSVQEKKRNKKTHVIYKFLYLDTENKHPFIYNFKYS